MAHTVERRTTKSSRTYDTLLDRIVDGHLTPGTALDKLSLAAELKVSRQPLDHAIDRLADEGLVDIFPQHGSFVAKIDAAIVADRFLVRRAIETEVIRIAAPHVTDALLRKLELNLRYQDVALEGDDLVALFSHDIAFHALIHTIHPFSEATALLRRNETYIRWVRRSLLPNPGRAAQTISEHQTILDALAARDGDAAAKAMRDHLLMTERQFQNGTQTA